MQFFPPRAEKNWIKWPLIFRPAFLCVSALCLPRPSLYRPQYYFWPLFFCETRTSRSSNSPWPTSTRTTEGWHRPQTRSQSRAAGIWGELPAALQRAGSARLSPAPAALNSAFLLTASFRIQYSGALCGGTQTHTQTHTLGCTCTSTLL